MNPEPAPDQAKNESRSGRMLELEVVEVTEKRLTVSALYDRGALPDTMGIQLVLLRKGIIYWSAPGRLSQVNHLNIPIAGIPSGL